MVPKLVTFPWRSQMALGCRKKYTQRVDAIWEVLAFLSQLGPQDTLED